MTFYIFVDILFIDFIIITKQEVLITTLCLIILMSIEF